MQMRRLFVLALLGTNCGSTFAQEDPFDLTATQRQVAKLVTLRRI